MTETTSNENIGKYMKDMSTVLASNDVKALADVDADFANLINEYNFIKNPSFSMNPAPLASFLPKLALDVDFSNSLSKYESDRSETNYRNVLGKADRYIKKILNDRKGEISGSNGFKKMSENRDEIIESCLPMVISVARRYFNYMKNPKVSIDDLIQAGNLGLVKAANKYIETPIDSEAHPEKVTKFSTYAYYWIRKYIIEESYLQATPFSGTIMYNKLAAENTHTYGIDSPGITDKLDSIEQGFNEYQDLKEIEGAAKYLFKDLSSEEKRVLLLTFGIDVTPTPENPLGLPLTMEQAGQYIGRSKATVSRMIKNSLEKLQRINTSTKAKDLIATLSLLQGIDLSNVEPFTIASTYN